MLLLDTRDQGPERPERPRRQPLWLDLPELRPWRKFLAAIVLFGVSESLDGWPALIPLLFAFVCVLWGLTSYYQGNDGMSQYRQ
jgi:hypothetical protein